MPAPLLIYPELPGRCLSSHLRRLPHTSNQNKSPFPIFSTGPIPLGRGQTENVDIIAWLYGLLPSTMWRNAVHGVLRTFLGGRPQVD